MGSVRDRLRARTASALTALPAQNAQRHKHGRSSGLFPQVPGAFELRWSLLAVCRQSLAVEGPLEPPRYSRPAWFSLLPLRGWFGPATPCAERCVGSWSRTRANVSTGPAMECCYRGRPRTIRCAPRTSNVDVSFQEQSERSPATNSNGSNGSIAGPRQRPLTGIGFFWLWRSEAARG